MHAARNVLRATLFSGLLPILLTAAEAYGKVEITRSGSRMQMSVTIEGVEQDQVELNSGKYTSLRLKGVDRYNAALHQVGRPELPVVRFYAEGKVSVSAGAAVEQISAESGLKIKPAQPSRIKLPGQPELFELNQEAYASNELQPAQPWEVEPAGSVNGIQRWLVTLYPVAYAPASNTLVLRSSFDVSWTEHRIGEDAGAGGHEIFAFIVGERYRNSPSLAAYKALKEDLGYIVETIPVDNGTTPEQIRASLKSLLARTDARLTHALIIGDAGDVPGKESTIISGVTDHYYRAIDTDDYASDLNGPDIGVGRVAVADESQLAVVLDKFTRYTQGRFGRETWLDNVAFIATNDRYEVAEASHNYAIDTWTAPAGYTGVFPADPQTGGDRLYAITHNVTDARVHEVMGMGRTIIDYSGHGSNTSWAGPNVEQSDVRALTDPDALPFVISNACITGDFRVDESFGETWQRHHAGAITFWGSVDSTYWDEDDILERAMFDGIYRDGLLRFNKITDYALSEHWRHYGGGGFAPYYWETYVLFGDPSLDLRTTRSRNVSIDGPQVLPVGVGTVTYTVSDGNGPAAGVRLSLSLPGNNYKLAAITDNNGQATFDIAAASRDVVTLRLTASGRNLQLTEGELAIIPADNPYLSFTEFSANNRADPILYLGEQAALHLKVTNLGQRATTGGRITIESVQGPATIIAGTADVPAMAARGLHRVGGNDLLLLVDRDAQPGESIRVLLKWETNEGQSATVPAIFRVGRAGIAVESVDFGTAGGLRPGEAGEVWFIVKNTGNETITDGTLIPTGGACVGSQGDFQIPELAPGASGRFGPVTLDIYPRCANGEIARLEIQGTYASVAMEVPLAAVTTFPVGVLVAAEKEMDAINLEIPDNTTVEHAFDSGMTGVLEQVSIQIRLTHSYLGDISIKLLAPDGTEVVLYDRDGGPDNDLDQVFGPGGADVPGLAQLKGKAVHGTWKVVIQDHASSDTGTLGYVKFMVRGYIN